MAQRDLIGFKNTVDRLGQQGLLTPEERAHLHRLGQAHSVHLFGTPSRATPPADPPTAAATESPPAAVHIERGRLPASLVAAIRYGALTTIYLSSTADMLLQQVGLRNHQRRVDLDRSDDDRETESRDSPVERTIGCVGGITMRTKAKNFAVFFASPRTRRRPLRL